MRSAVHTSVPAHWASWGDCLGTINARHPEVAHMIVTALENHPPSPYLEAAVHAHWPMDCDLHPENLRSMSRGPRGKVGNMRASVPCEWDFRVRIMTTMTASERTLLRSQSGPGAGVVGLRVTCCSSATFVSVCLCPHASADVAVPLTPLAIIAQLARAGEAGLRSGKVRALAYAEKQAGGSRLTSWCVIWTLLHLIHVMVVGWRSLLMACPFLGVHNLPWTLHWCLHSIVTGLPHQEQQTLMVQH